jgi:hypothetical protein
VSATKLDPRARDLLVKLLWMSDSPNTQERETATRKFFELLRQYNLTPADVLAPPPINQVVQVVHPAASPASPPPPRQPRDWHTVVTDIWVTRRGALFPRELEFIPDLLRKGYAPRGGQIDWLVKIIKRTGVRPWDIAP